MSVNEKGGPVLQLVESHGESNNIVAKPVQKPTRPVYVGLGNFLSDIGSAALGDQIIAYGQIGKKAFLKACLALEGMPSCSVEFALTMQGGRVQLNAVHAEGFGVMFPKGLVVFHDELLGERAPPPQRYEATRRVRGFMDLVDSWNVVSGNNDR